MRVAYVAVVWASCDQVCTELRAQVEELTVKLRAAEAESAGAVIDKEALRRQATGAPPGGEATGGDVAIEEEEEDPLGALDGSGPAQGDHVVPDDEDYHGVGPGLFGDGDPDAMEPMQHVSRQTQDYLEFWARWHSNHPVFPAGRPSGAGSASSGLAGGSSGAAGIPGERERTVGRGLVQARAPARPEGCWRPMTKAWSQQRAWTIPRPR